MSRVNTHSWVSATFSIAFAGAFAEFERSMIRQRVNLGLKRAVAQGKRLGRPKIEPELERRVQRELGKGNGILKVAKRMGLGTGTVHRIARELGA